MWRNPRARQDTRDESSFCPEGENNYSDNADFGAKLAADLPSAVEFFFCLSDKTLQGSDARPAVGGIGCATAKQNVK